MTYIVPVTAGLTGYSTALAMGHTTAAPFIGVACLGIGWFGRFAGHGIHLRRSQMRKVEYFMNRAMAANWGIRPLTERFEEGDQQRLLGSIFDAVAGEQIQQLVEQWPIIWAHVQRVHFSGIPPLGALRAMKRSYRPGLFGKDKGKARELAQPVVDAYASLHPEPDSAREWYMRWAQSIGLPEEMAHQVWAEGMARRGAATTPAPVIEDGPDEAVVPMPRSQPSRPQPAPRGRHLSEDEIERRMAAARR
jgi:hypothetical protein